MDNFELYNPQFSGHPRLRSPTLLTFIMGATSSRIWTRIAGFTSFDDNLYATIAFYTNADTARLTERCVRGNEGQVDRVSKIEQKKETECEPGNDSTWDWTRHPEWVLFFYFWLIDICLEGSIFNWFGLVLWHIKYCWLFNAKSSLYIRGSLKKFPDIFRIGIYW